MDRFVDFWQASMKSWRRVAVEELPDAIKAVPETDLFFSPHIYQSRVPKDGEAAAGPIYIDMDGPGAMDELPKVLGYWDRLVGEKNVRGFFSGMKGAHVYVSGYAVGVTPDPDYAKIIQVGVELMVRQLQITTVDMAVYSKRRLMRVPGSIHGKSGKRCAPWTGGRIANIDNPEIVLRFFQPSDSIIPWFEQMKEVFQAAEAGKKHAVEVALKPGITPPCVKNIQEDGLWAPGSRNAVSVQLSLGLKAMGLSEDAAIQEVRKWAASLPPAHTNSSAREATRAAEANVHWAYGSDHCRFLCEIGMRTVKASCPGRELCPAISEVKHAEQPSIVTLEEAVMPNIVGQPLQFQATPVAVDTQPYLIPLRYQLSCNPRDDGPCEQCPNNSGTAELHLSSHALLRFSAQPNEKAMNGEARAMLKVPKNCPGHVINGSAHENMVTGFVQPYYNGSVIEKDEAVRENQVYVRASSMDDQVPYEMTGRTFMHPKTLRAVHVIDKAVPLQRAHENMVLSPNDIAKLEVFQSEPQYLESKINDIQEDWEKHVHRIYGRRLHATMMSAIWFSNLSFPFMGKIEHRGWLDVLAVGDTAQGKSEMARSFLDFFNFGTLINGENVTFAGLVAGVDMIEGRKVARKGALPRCDGSILVVDEFGGMELRTISMLSQARSEGIAGMSKIIHREFPCRTGKLWIANAVDPQTRVSINMDDAPYPIIHVLNLFVNPEDVRRCDGVIGFRRMDETTRLIHAMETVTSEPMYTRQLSQLLQRWAVSRSAAQINFTPGGTDACVDLGQTLSEEYTQSIPLWVAGDSRQKVARWAKAFAAMSFSTDDKGERLIVGVEHAEFAYKVLKAMCNGPDLQFGLFTSQDAEGPNVTWDEFGPLCTKFPSACNTGGVGFGEDPNWRAVIRVMMSGKPFNSRDLLEMTDLTDAKILFRLLMRYGMAKKHSAQSYRVTPRGVKTFKLMMLWVSTDGDKRPLVEIPQAWFEKQLPRL